MVLPHPFHKRLLSRIGFYGGVACYLWLLQFVEQRTQQEANQGRMAATAIIR